MIFLALGAGVTVAAWVYILFVRSYVATRWPDAFAHIDAIEAALWSRSRTVLVSRLYWLGGIVVAIHDVLAMWITDWSPVISDITSLVPERYRPLALALFLGLTGYAFEWLRRVSTDAVGDKTSDTVADTATADAVKG